jgi:chaperone required for assembly of F1-ATPase
VKRFYKGVSVAERGGAFEILLDGKSIKTPRRKTLSLPTRALANAIAEEWRAQGSEIRPLEMRLNRLANTAIDRDDHERAQIVADILRYASGDLLCYRAEEAELAARQRAGWDPILAWLEQKHLAPLAVTTAMAYTAQPAESLAALGRAVEARDAFALTTLHAASTITGSIPNSTRPTRPRNGVRTKRQPNARKASRASSNSPLDSPR